MAYPTGWPPLATLFPEARFVLFHKTCNSIKYLMGLHKPVSLETGWPPWPPPWPEGTAETLLMAAQEWVEAGCPLTKNQQGEGLPMPAIRQEIIARRKEVEKEQEASAQAERDQSVQDALDTEKQEVE